MFDKTLMQNSGLYCLPRPGDSVMADRGFMIEKNVSQKSFTGSSKVMEAGAADVTFSSSKELHKLQYTTVLSDGDSKAFLPISKLDQ
ncbi:hypothetical protein HPB47_002799 [Ixodes persulcatus]|uniref:Uncharacterized protein n=1 Tax=Ixodes persulcatus TaxID=34615 RepID=A0AC60R103_IXOPE|nr:hypothetical protein HPB47_002799 [Ixodes persulcatus]